jgi:LAO/AO transport system kinase
MEKLSRQTNCFIRPSPSGGTLGGVTRKSRETILVCEAAGYDVILVETVGVGQSEITVRSMVDFFLLIMIAGAGDELQGIKRGVIEIADALLINKADGQNKTRAELARKEYAMALKYLAPATLGWKTNAFTCSALTGEGIPEIWRLIKTFETQTKESGVFDERRKNQALEWVYSMIENYLKESFFNNPEVRNQLHQVKQEILSETLLPTTAAEQLLRTFYLSKR